MRAICGSLVLKLMLDNIQMAKELFLMELEIGEEIFIPRELS